MSKEKKPGKLARAVLNMLGVPLPLSQQPFWQNVIGSSTSSGKHVTVDSALQLSAVFACVRLISETVSTLPLKVYQRKPDGSREPAREHFLYNLLARSPNIEMTPSRFLTQIVGSMCLWGNAYVEKKYIGSRLVSLNPLLPQLMQVSRSRETGALVYVYTENGIRRELSEKQIMHIRAFGIDGVMGIFTVDKGRETFGAAAAAEEAAGKFFENGLQASGFLSAENFLQPEQREMLRKNLGTFAGSKNAGKLMVLEHGMKYQGITINPEAAQMLETREFEIEEICRWFRVPPFMVGHLDKQSSWASSVEGMNLQFLTNTLRPLLVNIEQEISRCLIPASEFETIFAEFNVEGLLRADSKARSEYYNASLDHGWMNRNEVRQKENLPPIAGGEIYTVQSALISLDQVGQNYQVPAGGSNE